MTHSCDGQDARAPTTYEAQLIRSRAQSIAAYGSRLISHGMGPPNQVGPDFSQGGNLGLAWDFGQIVWRPHRDTVLHTRRGPRTTPRAPPPTIAMAPLCYRVLASLLPGRGRGGTHPVDSRRPLPPRRGSLVGRRARRGGSGVWHRPGSRADRHAAGNRLGLVARRHRHGRSADLHCALA